MKEWKVVANNTACLYINGNIEAALFTDHQFVYRNRTTNNVEREVLPASAIDYTDAKNYIETVWRLS